MTLCIWTCFKTLSFNLLIFLFMNQDHDLIIMAYYNFCLLGIALFIILNFQNFPKYFYLVLFLLYKLYSVFLTKLFFHFYWEYIRCIICILDVRRIDTFMLTLSIHKHNLCMSLPCSTLFNKIFKILENYIYIEIV